MSECLTQGDPTPGGLQETVPHRSFLHRRTDDVCVSVLVDLITILR